MAEYYDPETYPKEWGYLQTGPIIDQYMIERELARLACAHAGNDY